MPIASRTALFLWIFLSRCICSQRLEGCQLVVVSDQREGETLRIHTFSSYSFKPSEGVLEGFARLRLRVLHVTYTNGQVLDHHPPTFLPSFDARARAIIMGALTQQADGDV